MNSIKTAIITVLISLFATSATNIYTMCMYPDLEPHELAQAIKRTQQQDSPEHATAYQKKQNIHSDHMQPSGAKLPAYHQKMVNDALLSAIQTADRFEVSIALKSGTDVHTVNVNNYSALTLAVQTGDIKIVQLLLDYKANANFAKNNSTPLKMAILHKYTEIAALLIDRNAYINNTTNGLTPLALASLGGHTPLAQLLLNKRADANLVAHSFNNSPLIIATLPGHTETVSLLLKNKADVHATNKLGNTALMIASQFGNSAIATELILAGADPDHRSANGYTAFDRATSAHMKTSMLAAQRVKQDLAVSPDSIPAVHIKKLYTLAARHRYRLHSSL